jgi:hypothetical protein
MPNPGFLPSPSIWRNYPFTGTPPASDSDSVSSAPGTPERITSNPMHVQNTECVSAVADFCCKVEKPEEVGGVSAKGGYDGPGCGAADGAGGDGEGEDMSARRKYCGGG